MWRRRAPIGKYLRLQMMFIILIYWTFNSARGPARRWA